MAAAVGIVHPADVDLARQLHRTHLETFGGRWARPNRWQRRAERCLSSLLGNAVLAAVLYCAAAAAALLRLRPDDTMDAVLSHEALVRAIVLSSAPIYLVLQATTVIVSQQHQQPSSSSSSMRTPLVCMHASLGTAALALLGATPPWTGTAALAVICGWTVVFGVLLKRMLTAGTEADFEDDAAVAAATTSSSSSTWSSRRVAFRARSPAP